MSDMTRRRLTGRDRVRAFLAVSLVTFLVAGIAYFFSVRAVQGEIRSRASVVQLCEAGNESRAQQVTLWTHLVAITVPPAHETAAQRARRVALTAQLIRYVRQVFRARDCAARFKG